jgi:hypothetical protein
MFWKLWGSCPIRCLLYVPRLLVADLYTASYNRPEQIEYALSVLRDVRLTY